MAHEEGLLAIGGEAGGAWRARDAVTASSTKAATKAPTTSHLAAALAAEVSFVTSPLIGKSLRERGLGAQRGRPQTALATVGRPRPPNGHEALSKNPAWSPGTPLARRAA